MGDPSVEVTEEQRDAAQLAKSKAVDAISQGNSIYHYLQSSQLKLPGHSFSLHIEFF